MKRRCPLLAIAFLLALALPASAQTRFRLSGAAGFDAYESFAFDAGWEVTSSAVRGTMHPGDEGGQTYRGRRKSRVGNTFALTEDTANQTLAVQFQVLLTAGAVFTSGVTTVTSQILMAENAAGDDINQCILGLRVIAEDGTVRATLLAVANYGTTTELNPANKRNKTCANADAVTASYTTVADDYLVLEVGFQADGANGANPAGVIWPGDGSGFHTTGVSTSGSCPADETTTGCTSWFEVSNTVTRATDAGPVTRWWFPHDTAADLTPSVTLTGWSAIDEVQYRELVKTKGSTALTNGQTVDMTCGTACDEIDRVYLSPPLAAGTVFKQGQTTISGVLMGAYVATDDDILGGTIAVRVVSEDGTTQRQVLVPPMFTGDVEIDPPGANAIATYPFAIRLPVRDSYTTVAGDRLMVETGFTVDGSGTTPQGFLHYGEDEPDCDIEFNAVTECSGWIEFSNSIALLSGVRNPVVIH